VRPISCRQAKACDLLTEAGLKKGFRLPDAVQRLLRTEEIVTLDCQAMAGEVMSDGAYIAKKCLMCLDERRWDEPARR